MNKKPISPGGVRDFGTLRTLIGYLAPHGNREIAVRITLAMIFLITAKMATVYVPVLYKEAVDLLDKPVDGIVVVPVMLIVAYGMVRLASAAFAELRDFVFAKVGQRAIRTVALETFRHLHRLSLRFHLERQTGGLSRAIERGTKGIDFLLTFMLFNILPTLIEIIMVAGVLWWLYDIWYAVVTLTTIGAYIAFTLVVTEWRMKFRRTMNETDSEANTKAIDSLLNYETVKYFGNEKHEAERFDDALKRFEHAGVRSKTSLSLVNVGQGGIIAVGLITVMLMAGYGIRNGEMTVGDFVLVNTYLIQLYLPLNFLGFVYREIKQSLVDMESMFQLLDIAAEVSDPPDAPALNVSRAGVSFKDVRFGYDQRRPILKGVSFDVPPGRTVAIVGHSGAGKSTISRLLFRFYDLDSGDIEIDGQDISKVTQDSLRSAIGIVPQDTVLFNDTIFYNIRYGRPEASREEVEEAARMAQIHDFVSGLPEGYETMVGERGLKLSGGEKQRVAIARTLLKRPRIFLFDEATSALDSNTEKEIQASLFEVSRDVTTLVIAHRLSTIVDADEIIVLDSGEVVERGRHAELVALDGHYAEMWRRQQESRDAGIPIERGPSARALGETTPAGG